MESISERIVKMRKIWRLSVEDVSKKTGIALATYRKYEEGENEPTTKDAIALGDVFKVSLDYLFTGKTSPKDLESINRPLTREERNSDKWEELKSSFSKELLKTHERVLYAIFIDRDQDKTLFDNYGRLNFERILHLDSYDLLEELSKRELFDLHYVCGSSNHVASKSINDVLSFDRVFKYLKEVKTKDQKFIDYAVKLNPIVMLNYYFLQPNKPIDKKQVLKCLNSGGYIEKIVEVRYYTDYTSDWDDGEPAVEYKKGQDVFATKLLRDYCEK